MCQSTDSRTTKGIILEKACNNCHAKRAELDFSVLCILWEIHPHAGLPHESSLPFNPLFTHPDWAQVAAEGEGTGEPASLMSKSSLIGSFLFYLVCLMSHKGLSYFFFPGDRKKQQLNEFLVCVPLFLLWSLSCSLYFRILLQLHIIIMAMAAPQISEN